MIFAERNKKNGHEFVGWGAGPGHTVGSGGCQSGTSSCLQGEETILTRSEGIVQTDPTSVTDSDKMFDPSVFYQECFLLVLKVK